MGASSFNINLPSSSFAAETHSRKHKLLLICNYILLAASSSFIFLTLSLRLIPSLIGFFLILLHALTILIAVTSLSVATSSNKYYAAHMVATVLTAIFQGSVSVLIFASTSDFLGYLKSYVREEDGAVILKLAGSLAVLIFFLEWAVLALTFLLRYHAFVEGSNSGAAGGGRFQEEDPKAWSHPFKVYA